jgi:hypothetical protein
MDIVTLILIGIGIMALKRKSTETTTPPKDQKGYKVVYDPIKKLYYKVYNAE